MKTLQIKKILIDGFCMAVGIFFLKFIPMQVWGRQILFDASAHITIASFILYSLWFFIDQNTSWRVPFFLLSLLVLTVISFQRIEANAHNDTGLLLGLVISLLSIYIAERKSLNGKFRF